jgi:hypothetical protein
MLEVQASLSDRWVSSGFFQVDTTAGLLQSVRQHEKTGAKIKRSRIMNLRPSHIGLPFLAKGRDDPVTLESYERDVAWCTWTDDGQLRRGVFAAKDLEKMQGMNYHPAT